MATINQTAQGTAQDFNMDSFFDAVISYRKVPLGEHDAIITGLTPIAEMKVKLNVILNGSQEVSLSCTAGQFGFHLGRIADQLNLPGLSVKEQWAAIVGTPIKAYGIDKEKDGTVYRNLEFQPPVTKTEVPYSSGIKVSDL